MEKHAPHRDRQWVERATLIVTSITCAATLWTLWFFAGQLRAMKDQLGVMRQEERGHVQESAARLKAVGGMVPGVIPGTLLVGLVHEGPIPATRIAATAEVTLVEWPSGHPIQLLHKLHRVWDSMDSDPKGGDDQRVLVDELVAAAPLTFQDLEKSRKTVVIAIHLEYFNGFETVTNSKCLEWFPKYAYKGSDPGAKGFEDYGSDAGLVPCDQFDQYVHDAEIHKADRNAS